MHTPRLAAALACAIALSFAAPAQAFGDKPIKLVVPAPAGGTIDVFARIFSDQLAAETRQPVVVENKPGAGGAIAVKYVLAQPADGNTLLVSVTNVLTEVPHVLKVGFDPMHDLRPVAQMARSVMLFIAAPDYPAQDAKGAIAYIKSHPGTTSFASYSPGTASQYAGAILNRKAGLDMQHVPFAGSAPALAQVMGRQVPLMFDGSVTSKTQIAAGKVKLLGVAYKDRLAEYPKVPTMAEIGYPELNFSNWAGVFASTQTPRPLLEKMYATFARINAMGAVRERYALTGFEVIDKPASLDAMQADLQAEFDRNAAIVRTFNIKLD
ncbi:MAG: tripartite tricarboxylate transporter substrate binding protein [Proteobacteria bacterium]|nr:tripartite tricarboxylate transporter substrate binding protein [Pseudomonadota bacterium]